jgi:hypothetical protein
MQHFPIMQRDKIILFILTLVAMLACASIYYANVLAVGVTPDSAIYIASAKSLLNGNGLTIPTGIDQPIPMTHFGPLYPALIALLGRTGLDLNFVVKWINILLFTGNVFLIGFIVWRGQSGYPLLAPLASLYFLVSEDILTIHSYALSDPLFLLLCTLGLFLFSMYLIKPRALRLLGAIGVLSLAMLTRYAGIALIPTMFVSMIIIQGVRPRRKLLWAAGLSLVASLPLLAWLTRNFLMTKNFYNRELVYHPMAPHDLRRGLDTLSGWMLPGRITGGLRDGLTITIVVTLLVLIIAALLKTSRTAKDARAWKLEQAVPPVFFLFLVFYMAVLIFTILFVDAISTFEYRLLSPILTSAAITIFTILPLYLRRAPKLIHAALIFLFLLVISFNAVHALKFVSKAHQGSFKMYAGDGWKEAEIIQQIKTLPEGIPIYSNADEAIYYVTGRLAVRLPEESNPFTSRQNPNYSDEIDRMREILLQKGGRIVYFTGVTWRGYLPSREELENLFPLSEIWSGEEGYIYALK